MRRSLLNSALYLLCSLLTVLALLSLTTVFAQAEAPRSATTAMRPYPGGRAIVAVKINGSGPYDFMIDTGATTTVLDSALFTELGLYAEGQVKVTSSAATDTEVSSTVKEIQVEGLAVENLTILEVEKLPFKQDLRGVRGILGENYLHHFDVLIDNQHHKVTLDAGTSLAESLDGERMAITFPEPENRGDMRYRPLVTIRMPEYDADAVTVLLDSGADNLVLRGGRPHPKTLGHAVNVMSVNGAQTCNIAEQELRWGKSTVDGVGTVTCQGVAGRKLDYNGNLPTAIFRQIFISHAGAYAVVNPGKRKAGSKEMAVVAGVR
jgi:predicted aspartyl protease